MFNSILTSEEGLTIIQGCICTGTALILGLAISFVYRLKSYCSKGFAVSLALLPAIVTMLIIMVNGNLGTGIAVVGVFSLVRFRSQPGSAREILIIMLTMAAGLACGTGYITFAAFGTVIALVLYFILFSTSFGESSEEELKIQIPENLEYEGLFDDIFKEFTKKNDLIAVKTIQMGSIYELRYNVTIKDRKRHKEMLDAVRCRNGNLPVSCGRVSNLEEL